MFDFFFCAQKVLNLSSKILWAGSLMLLVGVVGAYGFESRLGLVTLVILHSLVILGPTLLKIGYVMRLLAQYRLSKPEKETLRVAI